ncbi:Na/Pi symporter [Sansalvadorimonas sp. 2012CJ34-2]|uniref:Na/Pi symporter n=1 Tax=Parendozoicomonas callyspongiae TaxID=2942213 RepID=A0ABT0PBF3_9GAMM|nr:Na/Pi symporter [Sansalvadorimonas sp. 2012CJ34-2]MCL6268712.1 Na/Pi symporter [Sansalvadorimonas sp. 2012CJ34-2]
MESVQAVKSEEFNQSQSDALQWATVIGMIYLLLVAVGMIGSGFKWAAGGPEAAAQLFEFATNPFMALIVGTMATAVVQSSSTVTSIIVGLVGGGMPVAVAIPMILGVNIGTTMTATLVSLGSLGKRKTFRRSFAAATVHGFFNLMAVFIFMPLEMATGFLEKLSSSLAHEVYSPGSSGVKMSGFDFVKPMTKPVIHLFSDAFSVLPGNYGGVALALTGLVFVFVSITILGKILKKLMIGRAKDMLHKAIGNGAMKSIFSGALITVAVQSSSTTTSLIVPLAGSGIFRLKDVYPFTLGANIGTCITALLAATTVTGALAMQGLQIALVHLMFNTGAVVLIYGIPKLRVIPYNTARRFAQLACRSKTIVFGYVFGVFFILPGLLIFITD